MNKTSFFFWVCVPSGCKSIFDCQNSLYIPYKTKLFGLRVFLTSLYQLLLSAKHETNLSCIFFSAIFQLRELFMEGDIEDAIDVIELIQSLSNFEMELSEKYLDEMVTVFFFDSFSDC